MHYSLYIDEILALIVIYCSGRQTDLLRFALTCRTFYEPAMNALWARAPRVLDKLFLCLPSDAVETTSLEPSLAGKRGIVFVSELVTPLALSVDRWLY